jgi:hypothetical protein
MGFLNRGKEKAVMAERLETLEMANKSLIDTVQNFGDYYGTGFTSFDGEKNRGELGVPTEIYLDFYSSVIRAWGLQYTNGLSKLLAEKWRNWVVGKGMRFNATPNMRNVSDAKKEKIIEDIEYEFRNALDSRYSDHSTMQNVHFLANDACYNSFVGGDVLALYRVVNGRVTIQLIDGYLVQGEAEGYTLPVGNTIYQGVELDSKGQHVAYHVLTISGEDSKIQRIEAFNKRTGLRYASLVYWRKPRVGETRGIPASIQDFEKLAKLDRYTEASVGAAEMTADFVYTVEHGVNSTGEDPFKSGKPSAISGTTSTVPEPTINSVIGGVRKQTGKTALNLPNDSKLATTKPNAESIFPDFKQSISSEITAAEGLPYEVAMDAYNSNYSASRAAIKSWEYNLRIKRDQFATQFLKPFYELSLFTYVTSGKIQMEGLTTAILSHDYITQEALFKSKFTGAAVPTIDPVKEVKAVRLAMGDDTTPLMTKEVGTQTISNEGYDEVQLQVKKEKLIAEKPIAEPVIAPIKTT